MHSHAERPHHTFMYIWVVGAVLVFVASMAVYAREHPRTAPVPTDADSTVRVESR